MDKTSTDYRLMLLEKAVSDMIRVFVITELDESKRRIRVDISGDDSAWLPWPASNGANFNGWRPLRKGQQLVIASVGGDLAQGLVVGELYSDSINSPSIDPDLDLIKFGDIDLVERNAKTGRAKINIAGGVEIRGGSSTIIIDDSGVKVTGIKIDLN